MTEQKQAPQQSDTTSGESQSEFQKVMGMYKCEGAKGQYISGKPGVDITIPAGTKVYLFRNERKLSPKHPDYNLCIRRG